MTTVVFRDGVLASDSQFIQNGNIRLPYVGRKIWRLKDGCLVGTAGDTHVVLRVITGASGFSDLGGIKDYENTTSILCVKPNGEMRTHEKGVWIDQGKPEFYAFGSGMAAAFGALHHGASAEEAVRIASLVDPFTDDRIQSLTFGGAEVMPPALANRTVHFGALKPKPFWKRLFA